MLILRNINSKTIIMSVKYSLSQKGNPSGELTFRNLSKEIADGSTTVSDTDVLAVLNDLTKLLARHLADGKIVRFGDFGSFQVSISSEGAETEEKFNASLIKSAKILFRPGIDLKNTLLTLKYEKVK